MDRQRVLPRLAPLTKDKRIRYRAAELESLQEGHLFCLVSGNMDVVAMAQAFLDAMPKIERVANDGPVGFWHVDATAT